MTVSFREAVRASGILLLSALAGALLACAAALTATAFQGYGFDGDPVSAFGVVAYMMCGIASVPLLVIYGERVLFSFQDLWDANPSITIGRRGPKLPSAVLKSPRA